ncbi:MAG: DegQ family serine endoprotease [Candidatus Eisenbacteria bacterium]|nr:DegQ family serine endoprotease [Candidatus Eisenbacteria bacterium]
MDSHIGIRTGKTGRRLQAALLAVIVASALAAAGTFLEPAGTSPSARAADDPAADREAIASAKGLGQAFTAVAREVVPSVVTITSSRVIQTSRSFGGPDMNEFFRFFGMPFGDEEGGEILQRGLGSGVIVSSDGYIVTNNHVVSDAKEVAVVLSDGEEYEAEIVGTDPKSDVAVIKIQARGLPAARLGDSEALEVGEWVLAVGSPFSQQLNHTVTAGIVSAKSRVAVGLADYEDFIQTDAAINPGNSGGALVDLDGRVVGINTAIASRSGGYQGVGFAIPINMVTRIKDELIASGSVTRGWLGVGIQPVTKEIQEALDLPDRNGVLISSVVEDSPAEKARIERQDVIVALNGEKVESLRSFRNRIAATPPGTKVDLSIVRGSKKKDVSVVLGKLPDDDETARPVLAEKTREKLGMRVREITPETRRAFGLERTEGVVVTEVLRGGAAAKGGVREGDVLLEIDSREIRTTADYTRAIGDVKEGTVALLLVEREGSTIYVTIRVPE